jgi:hypothetical protein
MVLERAEHERTVMLERAEHEGTVMPERTMEVWAPVWDHCWHTPCDTPPQ